MRPSLSRNKKGQTVDILGGIQRAIGWLFQTAPKPLLYLIFLLFLVVFSSLFSFVLNTTGQFCDTQGNEYSTGGIRVFTNLKLLSSMPNNDELNNEEIDPSSQPAIVYASGCAKYFANTLRTLTATVETNNWTYLDENKNRIQLPEDYY